MHQPRWLLVCGSPSAVLGSLSSWEGCWGAKPSAGHPKVPTEKMLSASWNSSGKHWKTWHSPGAKLLGKPCCWKLGRVLTSLFPLRLICSINSTRKEKSSPSFQHCQCVGRGWVREYTTVNGYTEIQAKKRKREWKGEITAGPCQSLVQARIRMRHSQPDYHKELVTPNNEAHWLAQPWWQIKHKKYDLEIAAWNLQCSGSTGFKPRDFRP